MMGTAIHRCPHISVTPEPQICRTLCWIRYRRREPSFGIGLPGGFEKTIPAASFLKHKLWRISNTERRCRNPALCLAAQVIDRSVICMPTFELARLLLVPSQRKRGALINEDESGFCLGSG